MALDDDAQIDPATLPENRGLINEIDAQIAHADARRERQLALAHRIAGSVPVAAAKIEQRVLARGSSRAREEDLRGGVAQELREQHELVLTEPKLPVPGWTENLGGFDIALVVDNALVVAETKWGSLRESMWDILKLASVLSVPRVSASVAIYGAPPRQWQKPGTCAQLFEDREVLVPKLLEALPQDWTVNLAGSRARPLAVPMMIRLDLLNTTTVEVLGTQWEVRTVAVACDRTTATLHDGWPQGAPPTTPGPFIW